MIPTCLHFLFSFVILLKDFLIAWETGRCIDPSGNRDHQSLNILGILYGSLRTKHVWNSFPVIQTQILAFSPRNFLLRKSSVMWTYMEHHIPIIQLQNLSTILVLFHLWLHTQLGYIEASATHHNFIHKYFRIYLYRVRTLAKYVNISLPQYFQINVQITLVLCLVSLSCPTVCNPRDCSPPGSSVHGILQAGTLE